MTLGRRHMLTVVLGLMAWAGVAPAAGASSTPARGAATSWSAPALADRGLHGRHVRGLSCSSAKFCAAVDELGNVVFYRGSSWSKPASVDAALTGDDVLLGISCTYQGFCVTFNAQGDVFIYNGHTWSSPSSLWSAGIYDTGAVSCPSTGFCALETGHHVYLYRSGHWSQGSLSHLTGVSCASSRFCVATSQSGTSSFASVFRTKWAPRRAVDHGSAVRTVSCASAVFCVAAGARLAGGHPSGGGTAVTYRGHGWSSSTPIPSAPTGPTSVSCPTSRFCAAVDASGTALIYNGTAWGPAVPIDAQHAAGRPVWVSCPSSSFCMAIDSSGYAMRHR